MRTPPTPGTAVKDPLRSMASRMYWRFSAARSWSAEGALSGLSGNFFTLPMEGL